MFTPKDSMKTRQILVEGKQINTTLGETGPPQVRQVNKGVKSEPGGGGGGDDRDTTSPRSKALEQANKSSLS